jgi:hypothetical protein
LRPSNKILIRWKNHTANIENDKKKLCWVYPQNLKVFLFINFKCFRKCKKFGNLMKFCIHGSLTQNKIQMKFDTKIQIKFSWEISSTQITVGSENFPKLKSQLHHKISRKSQGIVAVTLFHDNKSIHPCHLDTQPTASVVKLSSAFNFFFSRTSHRVSWWDFLIQTEREIIKIQDKAICLKIPWWNINRAYSEI